MFKKMKEKFKNYTKKDWLKFFYNILLLIIGNFSLAFGTAAFLVPNNIITGGVSGIAIVLEKVLTPLIIKGDGSLVDVYVAILDIILFIIGLIFLGWEFSAKTLFSVCFYPLALSFIMRVMHPENWGFMTFNNPGEDFTLLLAAISGSVFVGLGCAISYKGGGSTGGVDVITFIVHKYLKIKASITSFFIDAVIILLGLIVFNNFNAMIIGIIGACVCSLMIEKIFVGYSSTYVAEIVSSKWEEINEFILNKMERGSTILYGEGGYTGEEKKIIRVAFDRREYAQIIGYVSKIDPQAFVTVTLTNEVNGQGFDAFPKKKL